LLNDIRKDYLLDRWVVIATHRSRRPTDFAKKEATTQAVDKSTCPFCPGNERKTPPAVLVYLRDGKKIVKEKDTDGLRHTGWLIRCVPNLFSAFSPPERGESFESGMAVGHHEVLVESPDHGKHPAVAKISQLIYVVEGYIDRLKALSHKPYVKYVSIFRNHGLDAGASLSHAHSQIMATPMVPTILRNELKASEEFYEAHGRCVFCDILEKEKNGPRFIWENESFVAFAPWAGANPFEFWIAPKMHQATLLDMKSKVVEDLAEALRTCLGGLKSLLNDPPYNYGFHIAPTVKAGKFYHWHLEVYPKLSIWAGFEKSTGVYINVVPPESSAQSLKNTIERQ
jgi:UDPglucose--hexose-1-phosphate uridylyltransferase